MKSASSPNSKSCCKQALNFKALGVSPPVGVVTGGLTPRRSPGIALALAQSKDTALEGVMRDLQRLIENLGKTTNRNKNPSYAQLMEAPDLLDWL